MAEHRIYFSVEELEQALSDLGPPASPAEARVFAACQTFAELISDDAVWGVRLAKSPDGARQMGEACVWLTRIGD